MDVKYFKSTARLLKRDCVNKRGLDFSKEVLLVSVGQRVAELQAVKVQGQKKVLPCGPVGTCSGYAGLIDRIFF